MDKGEPNDKSEMPCDYSEEYPEEFDDGVVCFGPLTESQLDRYNKLPRRTVIPSDFKLR